METRLEFTRMPAAILTVSPKLAVVSRRLTIRRVRYSIKGSALITATGPWVISRRRRRGTTGQIAYSQAAGTFTNINSLLPANFNSQAVGIDNAGDIVGFYMPTSATSIGFLDMAGVIPTIDPFGSAFTQALGINNFGEIVGFYTDGNAVQHGYVDNGGIFTSFDPA